MRMGLSLRNPGKPAKSNRLLRDSHKAVGKRYCTQGVGPPLLAPVIHASSPDKSFVGAALRGSPTPWVSDPLFSSVDWVLFLPPPALSSVFYPQGTWTTRPAGVTHRNYSVTGKAMGDQR